MNGIRFFENKKLKKIEKSIDISSFTCYTVKAVDDMAT